MKIKYDTLISFNFKTAQLNKYQLCSIKNKNLFLLNITISI